MKKSSSVWINSFMALTLVCLLGIFLYQALPHTIHSRQPFETVEQKVTQSLDTAVYPEVSTSRLRRYLDLDPSAYANIKFFRNGDAMSANELCIVQFDDAQHGQAFEDAARKRIASQHDIYAGYAPEQSALMESALVDVEDNYALYYVGDSASEMEKLFESALKGGK